MDKRLQTVRTASRALFEAPTLSVGNGGFTASATATGPVAGYDVPLPLPELDQDYQTPGESGLAKWRFSGVYPVQKVSERDIDSMVDASKRFVNMRNEETQKKLDNFRLERIRDMVHSLEEETIKEEPTMSVGAGGYTSAAADTGPVAGLDIPIPKHPIPHFHPKKNRKKIAYLGKGSRARWMKKTKVKKSGVEPFGSALDTIG